jgi:lipopolysaccharide/colanic/teichoic acid biosynthesis glycosyltransferase
MGSRNEPLPRRLLEAAAAACCLILLAPLLLALALGVWAAMGRPLLFFQKRVGRGGRLFYLCKFRTLPLAPVEVSDREWLAAPNSRFCAWMRRTGLDEAPQLWNILRGEMSWVGPRPERPYFAARFRRMIPGYGERESVAPGITGWAQLHGLRGDTSIAERIEYDLYYLERRSAALDLSILASTAVQMFSKLLSGPDDKAPRPRNARDAAGRADLV